MLRLASLTLTLGSLVATAGYRSEDLQTDSFVGFSRKYGQFAIRRELSFTPSGQGRPLPGVMALQPEDYRITPPPSDDFTCAAYCKAQGSTCSETELGDYRKSYVTFARTVGGATSFYKAERCDELLLQTGLVAVKKFAGPRVDFKVLMVDCYCQKSKQAHAFTGLPNTINLSFIEVYQADGTLKRTFLEKADQLATLTQLRQDPDGLSQLVRGFVTREIAPADAWAGHFASGGFAVPRPGGKHAAGKCVAKFDPGTWAECGVDANCREVTVGVSTPGGVTSLFEGRIESEKVAFEAWWIPGKPGAFVGWLRSDDQRSSCFVVPATALSGCD